MTKHKRWPLPDDDFDRLHVLSELLYDWLPDSKYKIMIRKHNLAAGAIIEDTNFVEGKFDSQYGIKLPWLKGHVPNSNGGFLLDDYEEPRKRKTPSTGELRDTIILENDMFILCARNSQSLSDEDENFTWEVSENEARQVMQMRDFDSVQKITIGDLTEELGKVRIMATNLKTQAETYGREVKKLQERTNFLQQRNLDLEDQNAELYRQNKLLSIKKLTDESMLDAMEQGAEEQGTVRGMTQMQLIKKAAEDVKEVTKVFDSYSKEGGPPLGAEIKKIVDERVKKLEDKMMQDRKKEAPPKKEKEVPKP